MAAHAPPPPSRGTPAVRRRGRPSWCPRPTLCHRISPTQTAWGACTLAREVMLMGDFNYISLLPPFLASSPAGAADMSLEQTQGTLIKGVVLVLNSLLLERPAFISLAQQTTAAHRRVRPRNRLHCVVCRVFFFFLGLSHKGCRGKNGSRSRCILFLPKCQSH